jgi:uncharacterized protein (TIGR03118 family)
MPSISAAVRRGIGAILGLMLAACGGSDNTTSMSPALTMTVYPSVISAGQSVFVQWTSTGTGCTPGGAWSGPAQPASGSVQVTPTGAGTQNITLTCGPNVTAIEQVTINPASAYTATALVADTVGTVAKHVEPNLTDPWGLIFSATSPAWLVNALSQTSTLYDGTGTARATIVTFNNANFAPTGIVAGDGVATDFVVTSAGKSASASFIFDGKGGNVAGWSPTVDATHAITMYSDANGANYKGLTIASNNGATYLYAADFKNRKIDVFNNAFVKQTPSATSFTFSDPSIPATYGPFNILALPAGLNGAVQLYVAYAQQLGPANVNSQAGAGLGYVDVFTTNGQLVSQLVAGGKLNAPWGLALAPNNFGTLSNALLVGNFGDGRINGYDPFSGRFLGALSDAVGTAYAFPGLWSIVFGNGAADQPLNTVFYTAGTNGELDGRYGRIDLGTTPPALGTAPTVTQTVPASPLTGTVSLTATPTSSLAIAKVDYYYGTTSFTLIGEATGAPFTVSWATPTVVNGTYSVRAVATDVNGNVGSSAAASVTVKN